MGGRFLVLFGIFWTTLTLIFDGFTIGSAVRQLAATHYGAAPGIIQSSEVTFHHDSDNGTTHGVAFRYTYTVNDKEYTGTRYRYGAGSSSDGGWAHTAVAERPPGKAVTVYYNPRNPHDSVLSTGLMGSDLFMVMFMTPFNAAMLLFWSMGFSRLRHAWFKPEAGGVKLRRQLGRIRVRLAPWSPVAAMAGTTALLAFLSIFVIGCLAGGFHPTMKVMKLTWTIVVSGGLIAGLWHAMRVISGKYDLVIEEASGDVELPVSKSRKTRRRVGAREMDSIFVETIEKSSGENGPSYSYAPTIRLRDKAEPPERLGEWYDAEKAAAFVAWLQSKLRVPAH